MAWTDYLRKLQDAFRPERVPVNGREPEDIGDRPLAHPPADMFENAEDVLVRVDVPGAGPADVAVSVDPGGRLVLCARSADPASPAPARQEWDRSLWYRTVQLPGHVDGARATARIRDGVLTIRVPRRREARPQLIPVRVG